MTLTGNWSNKAIVAVAFAVADFGSKLAAERDQSESSADAFNAVFSHGVTIKWNPNCDDCRHGTKYRQLNNGTWKDTGKACGSDYTTRGCIPGGGFTAGIAITFASMSGQTTGNMLSMTLNAVHELAHVYDNTLGGVSGNSDAVLNRNILRDNPTGSYVWQQHPINMDAAGSSSFETFADTSIAWVYDAWNLNGDVDAIKDTNDWMDSLVP